MIMRWVPNDDLVFRIYDQEAQRFWGTNDKLIAEGEIFGPKYYPGGYEGTIPLISTVGTPLQAELKVAIEVMGVSDGEQMRAKWDRMCHNIAEGPRALGDCLVKAPGIILGKFFEMLGEPAPGYKKTWNAFFMMIPFAIMMVCILLGWILKHFNVMIWILLVAVTLLVSLGMLVMGVTTHKKSKIPWAGLAMLMILAVIGGIIAVSIGWNDSWRQWWWMHTGTATGGTAGKPAAAASDAAFFNFAKNASVDATRAAGFRNGDIYCAAPILDADVALGDVVRVDYWAIGINCCDDFGSFTCDAARTNYGGSGVVMKGGGMPCFDCHTDKFRMAAAKASGVNNMVPAPGALYVRYVADSGSIVGVYTGKIILSVFYSLLIAAAIFVPLGFIFNYKGFGKPGNFPFYNLFGSADAAKLPHEKDHAPLEWSKY